MNEELPALRGIRALIDGVDDGFVLLFAGRRRLVGLAARVKRAGHARDPRRERQVRERARRLGLRLGLPAASSERLVALLITDALRQQGWSEEVRADDLDQGSGEAASCTLPSTMNSHSHNYDSATPAAWLRWLPPPRRWAPLLGLVPDSLQAAALEATLRRALAQPLSAGLFDAIEGRRIGIEVQDLRLRWVASVRGRALHFCGPGESAEATVRGSVTDLLALASRREDADTLFFQRRLVLTGDVELGLTARNLLDQLPWHDVPLGLRILANRGAGLLQAARAAYRARVAEA